MSATGAQVPVGYFCVCVLPLGLKSQLVILVCVLPLGVKSQLVICVCVCVPSHWGSSPSWFKNKMSQGTSQSSGSRQQPPQQPLGEDRMDVDPQPSQPLSGVADMAAALADIRTEPAPARPIRNARRPIAGPNPADILRQRIQVRAESAASGSAKRIRTSSARLTDQP